MKKKPNMAENNFYKFNNNYQHIGVIHGDVLDLGCVENKLHQNTFPTHPRT